ncbi:MAG: restriction endonuclease subunit S [Candidatus Kryptoniota bacterium]
MKNGWQTKRLGEVCEIIKGRKPVLKVNASNGDLPYLVAKVIRGSAEAEFASVKDRNSVIVDESETIMICDGSNSGEVFTGFRGILSSTMGKISKKAEIDDDYLRAFLASTFDVFNGAKTGAAIPHLDKDAMYQLEFPLPPLPEQRRIVGILDEAFEGIAIVKANAEKNLQNARDIFESYLQTVFTKIGEGWVEKTIGEVCILRSGTTLPKEIEQPSGEIPYLKVADINIVDNLNGIVCSSRYINRSDVNRSNLLPVGTTIFPKRGGAILTNKKRLTHRIICADLNIMGVTPRNGLLPEFLFDFFLQLDLREINNGSSIPQINNYSIEPLLIAFPKSTSEQKSIVAKIASLSEETQHLTKLYERKLAALEELKKSLLHKAFSGEL